MTMDVAQAIRRFHRDDRGAIGVLLLLTIFALVAMIGLVWNVGGHADERARVQHAADASAHAAASWTSRGTNLIAGSNRALVRTVSAEAMSWAAAVTSAEILARLTEYAESVLILPLQYFEEWYLWFDFTRQTFPAVRKGLFGSALRDRERAIFRFQQQVVREIPLVVERQRRAMERFYACDIRLVRPIRSAGGGGSGVVGQLPVKQAQLPRAQLIYEVRRQIIKDRAPLERDLSLILIGQGRQSWDRNTVAAALAFGALRDHHVLATTSNSFFEVSPGQRPPWRISPSQRIEHFTVVSAARSRRAQWPGIFMSGLFPAAVAPAAYAQAETFPALEANLVVQGRYAVNPWRLWTSEGWNWHAKLSRGDALEAAMASDPQLRQMLLPGSGASDGRLDAIIRH